VKHLLSLATIAAVSLFVNGCQQEQVIDGYIKRQRGNKTEIMMHCNMGQLGYCDGYYNSGIFDSTQVFDEDGDLIGGSGQSDKTKYCRHYRFVKYDKPTLQ